MNRRFALILTAFLFSTSLLACGDDSGRTGSIQFPTDDADDLDTGVSVGDMGNNGASTDTGTQSDMAGDMASSDDDTGPDTSDMTMAMPDAGEDASSTQDSGADMGPDAGSFGMTCPGSPGTIDAVCDPVHNTGCPAPEVCTLVLVPVGPDVEVAADCVEDDSLVLERGSACTEPDQTDRCKPGLHCFTINDVCEKLCWLDTAEGCAPDEYCRRVSQDIDGLGFCADSCP